MSFRRLCRTHATSLQFAVLFSLLFYLVYQLKQLQLSSTESLLSKSRIENDQEADVVLSAQKLDGKQTALKGGSVPRWKTQFNSVSLTDSILAARHYLLSHINKDGTFVYKVYLDKRLRVSADYNLLRHAGSIYALESIRDMFPGSDLDEAIINTCVWLKKRIEPLDAKQSHLMAVWSKEPEVRKGKLEAKLGGAGLSLVVLSKALKINESLVSVEMLEKVGSFVEFMQRPNGMFRSKWHKQEGMTNFNSLYYPGEACLGLVALYQITSNEKWFDIALKAVEYLAMTRRRDTYHQVLPDHWALICTRELLKSSNLKDENRSLLIDHALKISKRFLLDQITSHTNPNIIYSFDQNGGICPACTRLEGLLAILNALPPKMWPSRSKEVVENGIDFVVKNQETHGQFRGGFRRQVVPRADRRHLEIRIDNVQHCATALFKYYELTNRNLNLKEINQTS